MFHCDPHAGNLFFTSDQRLAIFDWSLVGFLGESARTALVQIILGALTLRAERIISLIATLSEHKDVDIPALTRVVHASLKKVRQGEIPGFTWLMDMLDEAVRTARLRVGADLLLFRKTLHTLEGVAADIGAEEQLIDRVFLSEFLYHFTAEWPQRWFSLPNSRAFATRLSNADLAELALDLPLAVSRFWLDERGFWE
jgi:ubiquinone biosynthesis protein